VFSSRSKKKTKLAQDPERMSLSNLAYKVVSAKYFSKLILSTILLNCVFLAFEDPTNKHNLPGDGAASALFTIIFFVECVLKITAFTWNGYIEDSWNRLDFLVVCESLISSILALKARFSHQKGRVSNLSSIRTIRVLRVLRTAGFVPEIKLLLDTFFSSWQTVIEITVFLFSLILVFANFAEFSFQLRLNSRCMAQVEDFRSYPSSYSEVIFLNQICGGWYQCQSDPCQGYYDLSNSDKIWFQTVPSHTNNCSYQYSVSSPGGFHHLLPGCANSQVHNQTIFQCKTPTMICADVGFSPSDGLFSFDDIFSAMAAVFQAFTAGNWSDGMFYLEDAVDARWWVLYLFMLLLGSIMVTNLYPAIISVQLAKVLRKEEERKWAQMKSSGDQVSK